MFSNSTAITIPSFELEGATLNLPNEIYTHIFSYLTTQKQLEMRLVCKKFNDVLSDMLRSELFYFGSKYYLKNPKLSIPMYRSFVNLLIHQFKNHEISEQQYKKLGEIVNMRGNLLEENLLLRELSKITVCQGASFNALLAIGSLIACTILFFTSFHRTGCKTDLATCQEGVDQDVAYAYIDKMMFGAMFGFLAKSMDHCLRACLIPAIFLNDNSILPRFPLKKPLGLSNQMKYFLWRALEYRDLPILVGGIDLTYKIFNSDALHLDVHQCMWGDKNSPLFINNSCLFNQKNILLNNLTGIGIGTGMLLGFSMLTTLVLFYKIIESICKQAMNTYNRFNCHRLFKAQPSNNKDGMVNVKINDASVENEEVPLFKKRNL